MCGYLWRYMVIRDYTWLFVCLWLFIVIGRYLAYTWLSVNLDYLWLFMVMLFMVWLFVVTRGYLGLFVVIHGYSCICGHSLLFVVISGYL